MVLVTLEQVQKFQIREMELSFTQGRWNYERWGAFDPISSTNAKPPGVELWADFDVPHDQVDASWKNLTHTLSGLFCASINFLESSAAYSAPDWGFRPFSGSLRYGSLPREAVCTENLTPWLKLLPCRDKAGLAVLMDRPSIYRGFYHSQRLRLTSTEFGSVEVESGLALDQTLTVVLQPTNSQRPGMPYSSNSVPQPSWSLSSIFGRKVSGKCVLAKYSNVYIHIESSLVSKLKNLLTEDEGSEAGEMFFENSWNNPGFELSIAPNRVIKEVNSLQDENSIVLYEYLIDTYSNSKPFDLGFTWKFPVVWLSPQAPLHASRFLMGSGNERGAIAISLKAAEQSDGLWSADTTENSCMLRFNVFQVVPWYVKVYFHTLQVFVDEKPQPVMDVIERMHVSPSEDKVSPGLMEMAFKLPCHVNSVTLTLEFDKVCSNIYAYLGLTWHYYLTVKLDIYVYVFTESFEADLF